MLSNGKLLDDHRNKAILVNGHMIFGYTGLASMDNGKTMNDDWLLKILNESYKSNPKASLTTTAEYIAECATEALNHIHTSPINKLLAFVGIGWCKLPQSEELNPVYVIISNCHNEDGKWIFEAKPRFSVLPFTLPDRMSVMLVSDGQQINRDIKARVLRLIKRCVERNTSPSSIARILVATVREVASSNNTVGRNLLVNSIPKAAVHIGRLNLIGSPPRHDITTFAYVPENTSILVQYGPYVFHYGSLIKNIKCYYQQLSQRRW